MRKILSPVLTKLNKLPAKRKKILLLAVVIVIAGVAGYNFLWGSKKTASNYITSTVKKGTVANTIPATGTIEPVSTVSLSYENAEIIKKIYVKVGDHVTAGQLLAEQEEDDLQAEVTQSSASLKSANAKLNDLLDGATEEEIIKAEASVNTAQSAYDQAKANLERYQQLFDAGVISKADLDSYNNSYISAESNLRQAKASLQTTLNGATAADIAAAEASVESSSAQLKMKVKSLEGAKMTSPMNGIVSAINGGEGQRATANNNSTSSGSGFITLISEALQVEAQVNEADIGNLAIGQTAQLTVNSFPNKTFTGKVSSISPVATTVSNVQVYDTVIQLDENQTGLKAGMPATITIIVEKAENVLTVPKGAVTYAAKQAGAGNNGPGGGANVIVMDKSGNMTTRKVVLGLSDSSSYEVKEGLNEGETVVIGVGGTASNTGTGSSSSSSKSSSSNNKSSGGSPLMGGGPPR
ncbi:efflux RND transporter periplasmic adaptor subunit [Pelotomaculum propionicicum]|uniref:Macrolide export protein MacA n=1 Tax=Pelotomaculum propionicicum TaxID=258475 RepID=A0A4Y7RY28_9FIRM|nr:efflux RND transporter periplasmic adaptor subunit [Pelotomaculum propionicicum]NLI13576.1 HlyD family efflux transporter periplasmic adaptor subunit [Peptococcaceae bacterium]TEB13743.1 Macrolide export protein MacA [Pelotomaculum propionicicum]